MPKNTRLSGHTLQSEGSPFEWYDGGEGARWVRSSTASGKARCSCGETSGVLSSTGARKRWHAAHKDEIRQGASNA